ncbi:MAG: DUF4127 family protein [Anaerovibrio sp.]|uniref:DUF4127 family protein n=1 Tax=Anaerovibrio sp. TaxID=1872532 RepID=UPI0025B8D0D2|nr:DUF4127 family protein [Anaerovibrio sp.]MBE6099138.1 DUF4127 family protein [Anaerovibrio sp.]
MKKIIVLWMCLLCLLMTGEALAGSKSQHGSRAELYNNSLTKGKIVFIPQDNRPVSDEMPADTISKLGYELIIPPEELLGNRENLGDSDKLWEWLETNTTIFRKPTKEEKKKNKSKEPVQAFNPEIKAIVISSDSMIYGSLVGSRKHNIPENTLKKRTARFAQYKEKYPEAKLYVFASIMRTPSSGEHSGTEEPEYYRRYGLDIFRYTVLSDMADVQPLSSQEEKERAFLQDLIPKEYIKDWLGRREKNYNINKELLKLAKSNVFERLVLGRDDNARWSQTHMESRHLKAFASELGVEHVHNLAGLDEVGLLMLTRAVNDIRDSYPVVSSQYNWGNGQIIIPAYSDEPIDTTVKDHVQLIGGRYSETPDRVDLLLLVNTNSNGENMGANWYINGTNLRPGVKYFADMVQDALKKGYPVGIADVSFVNGSDNALMEELNRRHLLYEVQSYSGWNTPTNSVGFALAQGVLARAMKETDKNRLLTIRYMDDWAYQANVRQVVARQLSWFEGAGVYNVLGENKSQIEWRATSLLQLFAEKNLPQNDFIKSLRLTSPWNRLFEARIRPAE